MILRTMGPVEFVFDISDTEPINPHDDRVPAIVANLFPAKGEPPPLALRRVVKACAKAGIDIIIQDLETNLAGDVRRTPERTTEFCLRLNLKHTEAQQFGTLAHELTSSADTWVRIARS